MSYLWQEFNIKTFVAETLVFRDGEYCEELSEYENIDFDKTSNSISVNKTPKIPVHIIYIGDVSGDINFDININAPDVKMVLDIRTVNKLPTFLNISVKNSGINSVFDCQIVDKNQNNLKINIKAQHLVENTSIFAKTRVAAYKNTVTDLQGLAKIEKNAINANSDISFSVMADKDAKIIMKPTQYINAVPENAKHSSALYKPDENQVTYLRESGLGTIEVKQVLEEAFLE